MKILVVDDDSVVLHWVRKHLEKCGYEVEDACSGEQALHYYLTKGAMTWCFVLTDFQFIPTRRVRDGLHLVREIRAINPAQRTAIHTAEKELKAPVPVLQKPYHLGKLLRLLREPVKGLTLPFRTHGISKSRVIRDRGSREVQIGPKSQRW